MLAVAILLLMALCAVAHPANRAYENPEPNFFPDPAPFQLGVASGDPLPDSVILWTRSTPESVQELQNGSQVLWKIWSPPFSNESNPELQGVALGTEETDWTIKVDANPLTLSNRTYYYRFEHVATGRKSRLGRTRTAPAADVTDGLLSFASTTCTHQAYHLSIFAHLAWNYTLGGQVAPGLRPSYTRGNEPDENLLYQSESMTAVIHGGDSFYDYNAGPRKTKQWDPNGDLEVYVAPGLEEAYTPLPGGMWYNESWGDEKLFFSFANFPLNRDNWRWWHITSRTDPDRRAAMAAHPHILVPDSHDGGPQGQSNSSTESLKLFDLYYPVRTTYSVHPLSGEEQINFFRDFKFGQVAHLIVLDMRGLGRMQPEDTFWGVPQREWMKEMWANGTTGWRIFNNGKPVVINQMTGWDTLTIGISLGLVGLAGLGLACCVASFRKRRMLSLARVGGLDVAVPAGSSDVEKNNTSLPDDDSNQAPSSGLRRMAANASEGCQKVVAVCDPCLARIDCCPVGGRPGENTKGAEEAAAIGPKRRALIRCCGSRICILLGVAFVVFPFVLMSEIFSLVNGESRYIYHPEVDASTVWGEIINLVGSPIDRAEMFKDMFDQGQTQDNIFLTGDAHMFQASDVNINTHGHYILPDQADKLLQKGRNVWADSKAGLTEEQAKFGVEFMPSSTNSGGIYDAIIRKLSPTQALIATRFVEFLLGYFNPHFRHVEAISHGMGFIHVTPQEARFEYWRACVYEAYSQAVLYWTGRVDRGANQWGEMAQHTEEWEEMHEYP